MEDFDDDFIDFIDGKGFGCFTVVIGTVLLVLLLTLMSFTTEKIPSPKKKHKKETTTTLTLTTIIPSREVDVNIFKSGRNRLKLITPPNTYHFHGGASPDSIILPNRK